jgi:YbbR domain-containing protein
MSGGPLGWIVNNWRLKVLSVVLAVGLLGAVAFSENPPTFGSVTVKVNYDLPRPTSIVAVDPPTTVDVPVAGFRSDVLRYQQSTAGVSIDLTHAKPGRGQVYVARPRTDIQGLTFRESAIPITLDIEPLVTRQFDIEVRTTNKAPGVSVIPDQTYATCGNANDHCQVSVTGPASVLSTLRAYVDYDVPITTATSGTSPDQPIKFERDGHSIGDVSKSVPTVPQIGQTPDNVTVQVTTQGGSQTKSVPVSVRVQGAQPCGYQITGVDVSPGQVTINGPADAVGQVTTVTLDPIPLGGLTVAQRFTRSVVTGAGVSANPQQVTVNVSGYQAFNCAAPTPAAGVAPAPSPTPTSSPTPSRSPTPTITP